MLLLLPAPTTSTATTVECQIGEWPTLALGVSTSLPAWGHYAQSLVMKATLSSLERLAMVTSNQMTGISDDRWTYLENEANRREVDVLTVEEQIATRAELAKITPTNAELLLLADRFPAPQAWYDE